MTEPRCTGGAGWPAGNPPEVVARLEAARCEALARLEATASQPCCSHLPPPGRDDPAVWRARRHRPLLLVARSVRSLLGDGVLTHPHVGQLFGPRLLAGLDITELCHVPWAADNDCYAGFDEGRFCSMLDRIEYIDGGLFVTAPDVVADAEATLDLWSSWGPALAGGRQPVALVAQDGLEHHLVPWTQLDVLFVGGSTVWKLGEAAGALIREAKTRGKWVHVGRCNSWRRITHFKALGADSIDGTGFAKYSHARLTFGLRACSARPQQRLWSPQFPVGPTSRAPGRNSGRGAASTLEGEEST